VVGQANQRKIQLTALCVLLLILIFGVLGASQVFAQIQFEDVSTETGIAFLSRDNGSAWGDLNGDGWPDLLVTAHAAPLRLYLNNAGVSFTEIADTVLPPSDERDIHGAVWGDFDNDGDQDVFLTTGAANGTGSAPNYLFVNYSGVLVDEAALRGLEYPLARGRTPLWLDWNQDGLLDVFEAAENRVNANSDLWVQSGGQFFSTGLKNRLAGQTNHFANLRDLDGDGSLELIVHGAGNYPGPIFALGNNAFQDLRSTFGIPSTGRVIDAIIEDLDGDLDHDIFLLRTRRDASGAVQTEANVVEAYLRVSNSGVNGERGVTFSSSGNLTVQADPNWYISPNQIFIGSSGRNPDSLIFNVWTSDTGIMSHTPGAGVGIYIGYNPSLGEWEVLAGSPNSRSLELQMISTQPIDSLQTVGFTTGGFLLPERMFMQTATGFVDNTGPAGFGSPTGCESVVAGDFDNDADLDLYMVCRSQVHNVDNRLYENIGGGRFESVPLAGGAAGSSGGRGNKVTVVDYDRDGFLDLFVTNGWGAPMLSADGPLQLFRNTGNANHWIELDLEGRTSNPEAVGAKILLSAGGKTQLREQGGGNHTISQNHQRIHFGLGESEVVEQLTINWPSGHVQVLNNLAVDTIHTIVEDTSTTQLSIADASANEDTGTLSFDVNLTGVVAGPVNFTVSTADGTATLADNDYTALINSPGSIPAGSTSTTVTVDIGTDSVVESDETFTVNLALLSGNVSIGRGSATGTIINDDSSGGPVEVPINSWLRHQGGVTTSGSQVIYDGTGGFSWSAQVNSAPMSDFGFTDDFEVRFEILSDPMDTLWVVGLGIDDSGSSRTDVDYGLRSSNGILEIRRNGTWLTTAGPLSIGDILSIYVSSGVIEYRWNGTPVFSTAYAGSPDFYVDTAFKSGAIAFNVTAFGEPGGPPPPTGDVEIVDWVNAAGGVSASGNDLTHSGSPAYWVNTINSVRLSSLGAGTSYSVSWTVDSNPAGTNWVVGLGVTESSAARTDVDYGLRNLNGSLQIRRNGTWLASSGTLSIGDTLSLRVNGTTLEYQRNGITLYSIAISGTEDFYIDTAFKNGAMQLGSFTLTLIES
jgi:hypothetical protein